MHSLFLIPIFVPFLLTGQDEPNPKTLLPQPVIESIVNEVSGTLAFQHILELAGYEHDRLAEEYRTAYRESLYIEKMAKQYGLEDVHIERFKIPNKTWDGELGELWLLGPDNSKRLIMSYRDVAASLATGSKSGDVTTELIYVGDGTNKKDYVDKNVAGKVVLASGAVGPVHNLAVREFGAAGVVSFANNTGKPIDHPDQIAWSGIAGRGGPDASGQKTTWGFILSHRLGTELAERLEKREVLQVHAIVKATEYDADMQVPTCIIKGTGESQQELAMTGHLFEGIAKQGALDDASGSATALEVARAWKKLIDDGVLPRPRRTVRFLWVPEIQGTRAYLDRYPEETKRMVAAISMDMVGEDVTKNHNSLHLMRTPYAINNFINEVTQQYFEYVGDTNREKVQNRAVAYSYRFPILDPQGTRDQFYYNIDKHYGSSDHTVFLSFGVPAVLFNNWPDIGYHTSEDRSYNADPTQLKRAAFIGVASLSTMANAEGQSAVRIAEMIIGNAAQRTGVQLGLALQVVGEGGTLAVAENLVRQAYVREGESIRSAATLAENAGSAAKIEILAQTFVETGEQSDMARLMKYASMVRSAAPESNAPASVSDDDQKAARLYPVRKKAAAPGGGGRGGAGGPGGAPGDRAEASRNQYNAIEMRYFANGKRSILEIRNALSAEYGPQPIAKILTFFENGAKTGEFELAEHPASN